MGEPTVVKLAEVKCTDRPDAALESSGVGACICVCAFDPVARVAGMALIVLPESHDSASADGKYADTAIPLLLQRMTDAGADAGKVAIAISGGGELSGFRGNGLRLEVGPRNAEATRTALQAVGLSVRASDIGGSATRTVTLSGDGVVRVKTVGQPERELARLGGRVPDGVAA